jgi:hypothetical protein
LTLLFWRVRLPLFLFLFFFFPHHAPPPIRLRCDIYLIFNIPTIHLWSNSLHARINLRLPTTSCLSSEAEELDLGRPTRAPASVRALDLEAPTLAQVGRSLLRTGFSSVFALMGCACFLGLSGLLFPSIPCFVFSGLRVGRNPQISWEGAPVGRPAMAMTRAKPTTSPPTLLVQMESPADSTLSETATKGYKDGLEVSVL